MSRRYFCCCIPVRVGVFVTSLLATLLAGLAAAIAWFALIRSGEKGHDDAYTHLTSTQKTAIGVGGGVYTLIALVSLFGFIGSIIRHCRFVRAYAVMSYVLFVIQAAASGFFIYSLFHNVSIAQCKVDLGNGQTENCKDASTGSKVVVIAIIAVLLLIQAYIVAVIRRYARQLEEEQHYYPEVGYVNTAFNMGPTNPSYYPHQPLDQGQGLLTPHGHYPYSDPHHSFGGHGGH